MDWANFPEYVAIAATVVLTTGVVGASVMQFIKQMLSLVQVDVPHEWSTVVSSLVSGTLAALTLYWQGIPLLMAALAVLVALYAPKGAYDGFRRLDPKRAEPSVTGEARMIRDAWSELLVDSENDGGSDSLDSQ